jgi:hypothetical protein
MSASIGSERSNLRKGGTILAYIFSNQGWGSFVGRRLFSGSVANSPWLIARPIGCDLLSASDSR